MESLAYSSFNGHAGTVSIHLKGLQENKSMPDSTVMIQDGFKVSNCS